MPAPARAREQRTILRLTALRDQCDVVLEPRERVRARVPGRYVGAREDRVRLVECRAGARVVAAVRQDLRLGAEAEHAQRVLRAAVEVALDRCQRGPEVAAFEVEHGTLTVVVGAGERELLDVHVGVPLRSP